MRINVTGRHIEITDDIRSYVEKRANKLEGIFSAILDFQAVIEQEKHRYLTEVTLTTRGGTFHAHVESYDLFASLDSTMDKIQTQLRRHRERAKDWRHRHPQREVIAQLHDTSAERRDRTAHFRSSPEIVSDPQRFSPKPMTLEDAAMALQTSGDTLLLFMNADTGQINLLYEMMEEAEPLGGDSYMEDVPQPRYGWVEPEP